MTRGVRWLKTLLTCLRVLATSVLIVFALHLVAAYFGWPLAATAE